MNFHSPIVVTGANFRFIVAEQLLEVGINPSAVLIEPEGRNTAPAVLAAAMHALSENPNAVLLVAPSDHVIPDTAAFQAAVKRGLDAVKEGRLVTFGIKPDRPEIGYGWLELESAPRPDGASVPLSNFVEKPDLEAAKEMLVSGRYLWNSGIFLFTAHDIVAAFEAHCPNLIPAVRAALEQASVDLGFLRLDPNAWAEVEPVSLDYAVMEKSDYLSVVPFSGAWSDLGSWTAVKDEYQPDAAGVVTTGPVTAIDCHDSLLRAESPGQELVGIGLENLIVVAMPDAVLVADLSRGQEVKDAVAALKAKGAKQAEAFAMDHRPWGHFETLILGDRFHVKRIVVKPGASLSLQSHMHRAEHWIVVSGTARVTVDENVKLVTENESIYVPLGAVHRMENPGRVPMILIEVQTGVYLGEDDIIRYEDVYARA